MAQEQENSTSVGEWVVTLIVALIPLIGLIMLFVWAFGGAQGTSKANWAKAALIVYFVTILFSLLFGGSMLAFLISRQG
jgi:small neutral amino acid transporter SnatA (MarC family)